jgi:Holliday junction resolvasome RuvABC endonuclease subunit
MRLGGVLHVTISYLGIDPGMSGALALVTCRGDLLWVEDMPEPLHGAAIVDLLDTSFTAYRAAIEDVHSMPGQGVSSTFKFGMGFGIVLGALGARRIPYTLVTPNRWKKAQRVTADKDTSRARACELWPAHAAKFARKKDNGRAEAALIAHWSCSQNEGRLVA